MAAVVGQPSRRARLASAPALALALALALAAATSVTAFVHHAAPAAPAPKGRPRAAGAATVSMTTRPPPPSAAAAAAAAFRRACATAGLLLASALPVALSTAPAAAWAATAEPSPQQIQTVQQAFRAFDGRDLAKAERLFDKSVVTWEELERPRDEVAALLKARGNVRCDLKKFDAAIEDYNRVLEMMASDAVKPDGTAAYVEFPDTFVQRGLAYEGLGDWEQSVRDYSKAIALWGGGRGEGINPFVLTFRGNSLARLGKYKDAVQDYSASADLFLATRDEEDALAARANQALALYETGARDEAVKLMQDIVRRQPAFADMRVALAAHAWHEGNLGEAETQWRYTCDNISSGCAKYKDLDWVSRIRRWPPSLVQELDSFLSTTRMGKGGGARK